MLRRDGPRTASARRDARQARPPVALVSWRFNPTARLVPVVHYSGCRPFQHARLHEEVQEMFRTITVIMALAMLPLATSANAQGRGRDRNRNEVARAQGVPPGQLPPADMCRVWYKGQPPGRQPRPTSCQQAEAIAARDRNARVIYGTNVYDQYGRYGSGRYGNNRNGTYGRNDPYGNSYPYPDNNRGVPRVPGRNRAPNGTIYSPNYPNSSSRYDDTAYENGYRDGREQGLKDGRDNDRLDATRHGRYRSADRGYIDSYGDKSRYKDNYRAGFQDGYNEGYREGNYRR